MVTFEREAAPPVPGARASNHQSREGDRRLTDNYDFLPPKFNRPQQTGRGYGPVLASRGLIGTRAGRGWRNAEVPNELQDGAPGSAPATRNASSGDLLKRCEEEDLGCC